MSTIEEYHTQIDELEKQINSGTRSPAEADELERRVISLKVACGQARAEIQHEPDVAQLIKIDERMQKMQNEYDKMQPLDPKRYDVAQQLLQLKIARQRARGVI